MFTILDGTTGNILAVEISGGYTKTDVEAFKKAFEDILAAGHAQVNVLCKIDQLKITASEWGAFVADARYALANRDKLRHVAVVADSAVMRGLINLDNSLFGDPSHELVERAFEVDKLEQAWAFVRG